MAKAKREQHPVPAGFLIEYNDGNHWYWINDVHVTSVTSVFKPIIDKPALLYWSARSVLDGMVELQRRGIECEDREDAEKLLKYHGLWFEQQREKAARRGSAVHDAFERLGRGEELWMGNYKNWDADENGEGGLDLTGYVRGACRWYLEAGPEIIFQELVVGSDRLGFAGRFDLLCKIDDELWLIDLKTSKDIFWDQHFQLGLYALGCEESGYPVPERMGVLRLDAEGEKFFEESPPSALRADDALPWFRAQKDLQREVKELREAA